VILDRPLRGDEGAILSSGTLMLEGEDKPLLPVIMETMSDREVAVTLTEGRYHQVRRMFAAMGNHVTDLHRDRIGGLDLPEDLGSGEYRLMSEADLARVLPPKIAA
jgi:16S rRNA pseudouridine516 synthase